MDARQVSMVQESFEKIVPLGTKVAEIFYSELFAIDPSLRAMFKGDLQSQYGKLLAVLATVVRGLHTPEKIQKAAQDLAIRHLDYGVQPEHYTYVGNALLRTLKKGFGPEFTPELRDAWIAAFTLIARVMKSAAYPAAARSTAA